MRTNRHTRIHTYIHAYIHVCQKTVADGSVRSLLQYCQLPDKNTCDISMNIWNFWWKFKFFVGIYCTISRGTLVGKHWLNPINPELNPICYLLALLGAYHFLHVSRIRVKLLNFRRLMSYIYMEHPFLMFLDHTQRRSTVGRTPLD